MVFVSAANHVRNSFLKNVMNENDFSGTEKDYIVTVNTADTSSPRRPLDYHFHIISIFGASLGLQHQYLNEPLAHG